MKQFITYFLPPANWRIPVIILAGALVGIGMYIFIVSKAYSYLSDDPATCVNCHIMSPQYVSWFHSSHRNETNCNDCHVPHNNVFNKYFFKAKDGMRHATLFTFRMERQVIHIGDDGKEVVQQNCIRCHGGLINDGKVGMKTKEYHHYRDNRYCWTCHREVPHGRVNSLSAMPNALGVPLLKSPVPDWLRK